MAKKKAKNLYANKQKKKTSDQRTENKIEINSYNLNNK